MSTTTPKPNGAASGMTTSNEFITFTVDGQWFGIPVLSAQDVLHPQKIYRIPLAPPQVAGLLNLRGRIVTAIDLRDCLGLPPVADPSRSMSVVIEQGAELYSLLVDSVGDVLTLPTDAWEPNPATLSPRWREMCLGVYRLDGQLLLALNVARVLNGRAAEAA